MRSESSSTGSGRASKLQARPFLRSLLQPAPPVFPSIACPRLSSHPMPPKRSAEDAALVAAILAEEQAAKAAKKGTRRDFPNPLSPRGPRPTARCRECPPRLPTGWAAPPCHHHQGACSAARCGVDPAPSPRTFPRSLTIQPNLLLSPLSPGGGAGPAAPPGPSAPPPPPPPSLVRESDVELARLKRAGKRKAPRGALAGKTEKER